MTYEPENKSSRELEHEVERTRASVSETLTEIRSRMTPGQFLDEVVDYVRDSGGGEFARNLGAQVRDNPLPVLLIGAGIAWLMSSGRSSAGARSMADQAAEAFTGMGEAAEGTAQGLRDRASEAAEGLREAGSAASERMGQMASSVREAVSTATDRSKEAYQRGRASGESMLHSLQEQPVMLGALGLAVGAALGGALPLTRLEERKE